MGPPLGLVILGFCNNDHRALGVVLKEGEGFLGVEVGAWEGGGESQSQIISDGIGMFHLCVA